MRFEPARDKLLRARSALIIAQPFYGTLALHLDPIEGDKLPNGRELATMATDGKRLLFNPDFVTGLSDQELQGVVAHEIGHVIYLHNTRRHGRDAELWNAAGDYVINRDLIAGGFRLPKTAFHDPRFDGLSTDDVFSILKRERDAKEGAGKSPGEQPAAGNGGAGAPGKGATQPGAGGQPSGAPNGAGAPGGSPGPDAGGCGEVLDAAPDHDAAGNSRTESEWQARVRQAAAVARAAGKLPGGVKELIAELDSPRIDPAELFRRFVDNASSRDYSWTRPNRRHLAAGLVLPGLVPNRPAHIVAVVDTSGSTLADRPAFAGFLQAALDDGAADRLTVIYADTRVQKVREFEPGDVLDLESIGGGGTAFRQPLKWIADNIPDAAAVAYLTDCETSDWGADPGAPVLWLACGDVRRARELAKGAPFGEAVLLS